MPVLSAPQRRALMKKQAEVGLARNFERRSDEDCEKVERAKAAVKKAKEPPPETEAQESDEEQADE